MTGPVEVTAIRASAPSVDPTVVVFLSLYLILLTFFIMLAAASRSEERKVQLTLFGLETTFRGGPDRAVLFGGGGRYEGPVAQPIDRRLARLIEMRGLAGSVDFVNRGEDLSVQLPAAVIVQDNGFEPKAEGLALLRELVLAARSAGWNGASFSLPMALDAQEAGPEAATRAHALAARLAGEGIEIGIGFERRADTSVRLVMRPTPAMQGEAAR